MKKLLSVILLITMTVSLSACIFKGDKQRYEEALEYLEKAKKSDLSAAERAIELFTKLEDYEDSEEKLQEALDAQDKILINDIVYDFNEYQYTTVEMVETAKKMNDKKAAEKLIQYCLLKEKIQSAMRNGINKFKEGLKDPSSYEDLGSTINYNITAGENETSFIIEYNTLNIRYSATNSFGGRIKDQKTYNLSSTIEFSVDFKITELTQEELLEVYLTEDYFKTVIS